MSVFSAAKTYSVEYFVCLFGLFIDNFERVFATWVNTLIVFKVNKTDKNLQSF